MKPTNLRAAAFFALAMAAAMIGILAPGERPAYAKTALEMLRETPKPQFREGHTFLPLTRWGWTMAYDVRVELAEHWGYALEFGPYATINVVKQLDDPKSVPSKLCALTASNPKKYPLFVLTDRPFYDKKFLAGLPATAWCHDAEGKLITTPGKQLSPEAPDEDFRRAGELTAEPLKRIRQKAPIAIILNGGEYGLGVIGFAGPVWERDPAVVKAKGERSWFDYVSERKARQELPISQAVREAIPDRLLYVYYHTSGSAHRNRFADWWRWHWDYRWMKPVSDLASISIYYKDFNTGWTGANDMLTQALNSVGRDIALGQPLSYDWLCGGYTREKLGKEAFSDPEHYMGFLKCYYTAGMIGGVAGYFSYEKGGFEGDLGERTPSWLEQMIVLAHAQALFSHLEHLIRSGDLLPGPERHRWSKDQPAYEFPTGDKEARVVARRHKSRAEWLITAWAAGGQDRPVRVAIPELGAVTLLARRCGTVYRATTAAGKPSLVQMDRDGMFPTAENHKGVGRPSPSTRRPSPSTR